MKSIISRYGELKENPTKLIDSEGEELSLNKVDKALQSVGITLHDINGQFRDFDEVIFELAGKWNTIDQNTKRYIATVMAGNRQQSRFLALLSSYDRLVELSDTAANSEDAATLQVLKTMDSIEFKAQQLQTSLQSLYTSSGLEEVYKTILDMGNSIIQDLSRISQAFGSPIAAVATLATQFTNAAVLVTNIFSVIKNRFLLTQQEITARQSLEFFNRKHLEVQAAGEAAEEIKRIHQQRVEAETRVEELEYQKRHRLALSWQKSVGMTASLAGTALSTIAAGKDIETQRQSKAALTGISSALQGIGTGFMVGGVAGGVIGTLTALPGVLNAIGMATESTSEKVERLKNNLKETSNEMLTSKNEVKTLKEYKEKYDQLYKSRNDSNEAYQEWLNLNNDIAEKYPELLSYIDSEGNYIVNLDAAYESLLKHKTQVYNNDFRQNAKAQIASAFNSDFLLKEKLGTSLSNETGKLMTSSENLWGHIGEQLYNTPLPQDEKERAKHIKKIVNESVNDDSLLGMYIPSYFNGAFTKKNPFHTNAIDGGDYNYFDNYDAKVLENSTFYSEKYFGKFYRKNNPVTISAENFLNTFVQYLLDTSLDTAAKLNELESIFPDSDFNEEILYDYQRIIEGQEYLHQFGNDTIEYFNNLATINALNDLEYNYDNIQTVQAQKKIHEAWLNSNEYKSLTPASTEEDIANAWDTFYSSIPTLLNSWDSEIKNYYGDLPEKEIDKANNIFINLLDYSLEQVQKILNLDTNSDLYKFFQEQYDEQAKNAQERFSNYATSNEFISDSSIEEFLQIPVNYLDSVISNFKTIESNKNLTATAAEELTDKITELYWTILGDIENPEQQKQALDLMKNADLFSLTGLNNFYNQLKDLGLNTYFDEIIPLIKNLIPKNINTEFSTLQKSYISSLEDYDKIIKKINSGLEFSDMVALADKLKIDYNEFELNEANGLYYIKDIQLAHDKYLQSLYDNLEDLNILYNGLIEFQNSNYGTTHLLTVDWQSITLDNIDSTPSIYLKSLADVTGFDEATMLTLLQSWDKTQPFEDFIAHYINNYTTLINDATNRLALAQLKIGNIEGFVKTVTKDLEWNEGQQQAAILSILSGQIPEGFEAYGEAIQKAFSDLYINTYSGMIAALEHGTDGVIATEENIEILSSILGIADIQLGQAYNFDNLEDAKAQLLNTYSTFLKEPNAIEEVNKLLDQIFNIEHKNYLGTALKDVASNYDLISREQASAIATAYNLPVEKLFDISDAAGNYALNLNNLHQWALEELNKNSITLKDYNEIISESNKHAFELSAESIIGDIAKDRESLSEENIQSLANLLHTTYDQVSKFFISNGDGTYRTDLASIKQLVTAFGLETNQAIQDTLTEIFDEVLSQITGLVGNQSKGFTNIADMQKYVKNYNEQFNTNQQLQDMFAWNEAIHAFTFTTEGLFNNVRMMASQMAFMSEEERFVAQKMIEDTGRQFAEAIDIFSYVDAENDTERSIALEGIHEAVKNYDYYTGAIGQGTLVWFTRLEKALKEGGLAAISAAQQIATLQGKTLSNDEITKLYRIGVEQINNTFDSIAEARIGNVITLSDNIAATIKATAADSGLSQIANTNQYIVTNTEKLVDQFRALYKKLKETTGRTLTEVNEAYAQLLMLESDQTLIDVLNSGGAMSIDELNKIVTQAGYALEDVIQAFDGKIIEAIGGGNYRIKDWKTFSDTLNLGDITSEEGKKALNTFNDAIIEAEQNTTNEILEEIKNLSEIKPGNKINLTYLYNQLSEEALSSLNEQLNLYGADLQLGILDIQSQGNLLGIIQTITSYAEQYGGILESDIAELAETIHDLLQSFADAIVKGLQGTLTNIEANELATTAKNSFGIDLTFTQTVNGLKLSTDAATELYYKVAQIDQVAAHPIFEELTETLTSAGEACETMASTMAEIKRLEEADGDAAQRRLQLYKEIAATQMSNPDSYKFMDNALPKGLQGPENYWNSVGKMFEVMNGVKANKGKMAIQDFYNIVNELNNLAALGSDIEFLGTKLDGNMKTAAALIQQGMSALTNIDGKGVMIDLSKFGTQFLNGATSMGEGIDDGIHAMADSQIKMLDGLIQLMETVVAMEELGEIDVNGNAKLDFKELFNRKIGPEAIYEATDDTKRIANHLLELSKSNEDLNNALESISVGNIKIGKILQDLASGAELDMETANLYKDVLNSLYKMALSGDYDLDDILNSLEEHLTFSDKIATITTKQGTTIAVGWGVTLESDENGVYIVDGHKYNKAEPALAAVAIQQFKTDSGKMSEITETYEGYQATITIQDKEIQYNLNKSTGKITYSYGSLKADSYEELIFEIFKSENEEYQGADFSQLATDENLRNAFLDTAIKYEVNVDGSVAFNNEQLQAATYDSVQKARQSVIEYLNDPSQGLNTDLLADVGINVTPDLKTGQVSNTDMSSILNTLGIEDKAYNMSITANVAEGTSQTLSDALLKGEFNSELSITLNADKEAQQIIDLLTNIEHNNDINIYVHDIEKNSNSNNYNPKSHWLDYVTNDGEKKQETSVTGTDSQSIISELQEQIKIVQEQIAGKSEQIKNLQLENAHLISEQNANESIITEKESQISELTSDKESLSQINDSLSAQITEKDTQINTLTSGATELEKQLGELSATNSNLTTSLETAESQIEAYEAEIGSKSTRLTDLTKQLTEQIGRNNAYKTENEKLNDIIGDKNALIATLETRNGTLEDTLKSKDSTIGELEKTIKEQERTLSVQEVENNLLSATNSDLTTRNLALQAANKEALDNLKIQTQAVKDAQAETGEWQRKYETLEDINSDNTFTYQNDLALKQEQIEELTSINETNNNTISDNEKTISSLRKENELLAQRATTAEITAETQTALATDYASQITSLEELINASDTRIGDLSTQLTEAQGLYEDAQTALETNNILHGAELADKENTISTLQADIEAKNTFIDSLNQDIETEKANNAKLRADLLEAQTALMAQGAMLATNPENDAQYNQELNRIAEFFGNMGESDLRYAISNPAGSKPDDLSVSDEAWNAFLEVAAQNLGIATEEAAGVVEEAFDTVRGIVNDASGAGSSPFVASDLFGYEDAIWEKGRDTYFAQLTEEEARRSSTTTEVDAETVEIEGEEVELEGPVDIPSQYLDWFTGDTDLDQPQFAIKKDFESAFDTLTKDYGYAFNSIDVAEQWGQGLQKDLETVLGRDVSFEEVFSAINADSLAAVYENGLKVTEIFDTTNGKLIDLTGSTGTASAAISWLKTNVSRLGPIANSAKTAITNLVTQLEKLSKPVKIQIEVTGGSGGGFLGDNVSLTNKATGNVALAAGTRKTLMGELGPELWVSNGHYYVAGQNGAEFVDLPNDAIVFNHLQTERLLKHGSAGRGAAVTNERAATSLATGNVSGPAMANAPAVLAQLKQIRAMWQSLLNASIKDMGALAGSGGGGGGGGKKGLDKGFIEDLERWYTLLQQIASLERQINEQEKLRTKLSSDLNKNGYEYYNSQVKSLQNLTQQIAKRQELHSLQESYMNARVEDLKNSPAGKIFTWDDAYRTLTYNDQSENSGLRFLADLLQQRDSGEVVHTGKEQYDMLMALGFEEWMKYDESGEEININEDGGYAKAVEAALDHVDSMKDGIQELVDSLSETEQAIMDNENAQNQILQEMVDNQLSLEEKILKAIEDREQAIIDKLKDTRDAIDESQKAFVDGLNDQLDKEKQMYDRQESDRELDKLRRQLGILQRSGGSASAISSLQQQIREKEQDTYFEAQQEQIDAIQEASDKEIERLDAQIDLMTETLEYQKEHGLLWNEVYQVMAMEEADILNFIQSNGKDWESKSSLQIEMDLQALKFIIEKWIGRRDDKNDYVQDALEDTTVSKSQDIPYKTIEHKNDTSSTSTTASTEADKKKTGSGGGGSSSGSSSGSKGNSIVNNKITDNEHMWTVTGRNPFNNRTATTNILAKNRATAIEKFLQQYHNFTENLSVIKKYSKGGLVDYTGLAMVHGSKTKPEAFLNAEQTDRLKVLADLTQKNRLTDEVLDMIQHAESLKQEISSLVNGMQTMKQESLNRVQEIQASSAMNTLKSIREMWQELQSSAEIDNNSAAINIEHVDLSMNVQSISDDYSARRAGEQALSEIVRIARKTGAQGVSRR